MIAIKADKRKCFFYGETHSLLGTLVFTHGNLPYPFYLEHLTQKKVAAEATTIIHLSIYLFIN
ncbi:hypothetical protein [Ammoniphilus resinae]|uniref:hypothetical protein n=1 Tax=Ammoniphilus resinae TaxID=861532 RepID=UPI001AE8E782|nr:hypothetical protein [Ammoniphilus resinae]